MAEDSFTSVGRESLGRSAVRKFAWTAVLPADPTFATAPHSAIGLRKLSEVTPWPYLHSGAVPHGNRRDRTDRDVARAH